MRDHIDKNGWVYRNAYPFEYKPSQVHICVMRWWRLPVFGFLRILASVVHWFFELVFGLSEWPTMGLSIVLMGKKFIYLPSSEYNSWIIGGRFLDRIFFFNYKAVPTQNQLTIAGVRILPWHVLAAIGIPFALWYLAPYAGRVAVSSVHGVWNAATWLEDQFMNLLLWIPASLAIATAMLVLIIAVVRQFKKSEAYALWKMRAKAKVDKICPILPVR